MSSASSGSQPSSHSMSQCSSKRIDINLKCTRNMVVHMMLSLHNLKATFWKVISTVGSENMTDGTGVGLALWMGLLGEMVNWKTLKLAPLMAYSKLGASSSGDGFPHSLDFASPWCSVSSSSLRAVVKTQGFSCKSLLTSKKHPHPSETSSNRCVHLPAHM